MKKIREKKVSNIPEFKSFDEEREYWESRGPLTDGQKSELNRPGLNQNRTSFLSVRLTGEELDRVYEISKERGVGPSTFTRMVLTSVIEQHDRPKQSITMEQFCEAMVNAMPQSLKDKFADFAKDVNIPNPDKPSFFILDPKQMADYFSLSFSFMNFLVSYMVGVQLIKSEKKNIVDAKA